MKSVDRVWRLYGTRTSDTSVDAYISASTIAETTATRWRRNFHHISIHCEARGKRSCSGVSWVAVLGSNGAVET